MTRRTFTLPETHAAFSRWCEITGLDAASAQWAEVWDVLDEAGLIACDRCPQRSLFDDESTPLGETPGARRLRLVLLAGAEYARRSPFDVVDATAVAATMVDVAFGEELSGDVEQDVTLLAVELPRRVTRVFPAPSDALAWILHAELAELPLDASDLAGTAVEATLREAKRNDAVAVRVFERLSSKQGGLGGLAVAPIVTGSWVLYETH